MVWSGLGLGFCEVRDAMKVASALQQRVEFGLVAKQILGIERVLKKWAELSFSVAN